MCEGEYVRERQVIADGPSTDEGEIALGHNVLIGFMTWEGYNYEDAVLHQRAAWSRRTCTPPSTSRSMNPRPATPSWGRRRSPAIFPTSATTRCAIWTSTASSASARRFAPGDILVGKVTPKGETELTAEERLLRAIFGEKAREVRDTSLRVPHGEFGIIVDVKNLHPRESATSCRPASTEMVRVYIAQKRKIQVGDKMAGRHGNKGVVSRVLPRGGYAVHARRHARWTSC